MVAEGYSDDISRVEVVGEINGRVTTCLLHFEPCLELSAMLGNLI